MSDVVNVSSDVLEDEGDDQVVEQTPEELEKLPLHLHPRGKELVAEKNAAKADLARWSELGGNPEVVAERLRRLEMWEAAQETEDEVKEAPKSFSPDQLAEKAKRDYARQVLEDLAPEIKVIGKLQDELKEAKQIVESFKVATEDVAWDTTVEIAKEMGIEPKALAELTIPVIRSEPKLGRLYHSGRSDKAVTEAVKILKAKVGGTKDSDTINERAEKIKASETVKDKVPRTHAPGKSEVSVKESDKPKDFKESEKAMLKRLERQGV